jgi:hypothetical protein
VRRARLLVGAGDVVRDPEFWLTLLTLLLVPALTVALLIGRTGAEPRAPGAEPTAAPSGSSPIEIAPLVRAT